VQVTLIDARYKTDIVYQFAAEYEQGVYPILGRDAPARNAKMKEFNEYTSKAGTRAFNLNITLYKDRLAASLKRDWDGGELQPMGYPNYPQDYGDDYFRQYESEYKMKKKHPVTNMPMGFYWIQIPNHPNHAWDCRVYNLGGLDLLAYEVCFNELGIDGINYPLFWEWVIKHHYYYST
jgi:phage terminase large subunit GpA-like protein